MAPQLMTDMQKLNEHLSTRSYFDGGYQPGKADLEQLAVTPENVSDQFPHVARWRCHIAALATKPHLFGAATATKGASPKHAAKAASPKKVAEPAPAPKKGASPKAAAAPAGDNDAQIKAVGDQIRVLKEKLKADGLSGKKINEHGEVKALVEQLTALKSGAPASAAPAPVAAKAEPPKAASPKQSPKGKKAKEPAADKEKPAEDPAKKLKKAIKEGGKRGVEIEGAADMGGLQFFCTSVDEPEGDTNLLLECVKAMNFKSDPTEEERKGGSGHIGKMVFSAGTHQLAILAYVPEEKQGELVCEEWMQKLLALWSGKLEKSSKDICIGTIATDGDKNIFPLKIREGLILEANNFLRKKGLFPEDNGDDSDEMVFGDDDFPSM